MSDTKPTPLDKLKSIIDKLEIHEAGKVYHELGLYLGEKLKSQLQKMNELSSKLPNNGKDY